MNELIIFCDGGSRGNPGKAACSFIVQDNQGKILFQKGTALGIKTNNEAEYYGVLTAYEWLVEKRSAAGKINFYLDSKLVVNQLRGLFKIKNSRMAELIFKIKTLETNLNKKIDYFLIPREKNYLADQLVNQTLDSAT